MPRSTEILLVVATLLILGADVAIFVAPTIGVYAFIAAAPLAAACVLIERARHDSRH